MATPERALKASGAFDVFLCYNRADRSKAEQLLQDLFRIYNIVAWMDRRALSAGVNFEAEIRAALNACTCFVLALGEEGAGPYQRDVELPLARERERTDSSFRILPVVFHDRGKEHLIELGFPESTHFANISDPARNIDALWSLASGIRPGLPHPEEKWLNSIRNVDADYLGWEKSGRKDSSFLLAGTALRDARELQRENPQWLRPEHAAFLAESEQNERRRTRRRTRIAVGVAIAGVSLSAIAGFFYFQARASERQARAESTERLKAQQEAESAKEQAQLAQKKAESQRDRAIKAERETRARELAVESSDLSQQDWRTRLLLAAESVQRSPAPEATRVALRQAMGLLTATPIPEDTTLSPHARYLWRSLDSSDGEDPKRIRIWSQESGRPVITVVHAAKIDDVVFDDAETLVAVSGEDGWVGIYELPSGRQRSSVPAEGERVDVRVSSHGQWLAISRSKNRLSIVNTNKGNVVQSLALPAKEKWNRPWRVAFDNQERYCAMSTTDSELIIADLQKGDSWREDRKGTVGPIAFDNTGHYMAVAEWVRSNQKGSANAVYLMDMPSRQIHEVFRHIHNPIGLEFSPNGAWLASLGGDGLVTVTNTENSKTNQYPDTEPARSMVFRPDSSELLTGGERGHLRGIPLSGGEPRLEHRDSTIRQILFAGSGSLLITQEEDGGVFVLDAENYKELAVLHSSEGFIEKQDEGVVRLYPRRSRSLLLNVMSRNTLAAFDSPKRIITAALSPDSTLAAIAYGEKEHEQIQILSTENFKTRGTFPAFRPKELLFDGQSSRLAVTSEVLPEAEIIQMSTGKSADVEVPDAYYSLNDFAFSPDGHHALLAALLGPVRLVDFTGHDRPWQEESGQALYQGVFSFDGTRYAAIASDLISVWRTAAPGKLLLRKSRLDETFWSACFSYDNRMLSVLTNRDVQIFDIGTQHKLDALPLGADYEHVIIACSPKTPMVAIASQDAIKIVSTANLQVLFEERGKIEPVLVQFAPTGKYFAVAGRSTLQIVDVRNHRIVRADLPGEPYGLAWTNRSERLRVLTVEPGNRRRLMLLEFPITPEGVVSEVCAKATSNLSASEWDQYLKGVAFRRTCESLPLPE